MSAGRVLIVDDDQDICELFSEPIQEAGFHVDTASTRLEACEKIRCKTYHVALIDIMLTDDPNDRSGIEVLRYLTSLDEGTRPIVVSATEDVRVPVEVMKQGTYSYMIKKDFSPEDIVNTVKKEYSKCEIKNFGKYSTFTAYLAGAGQAHYYESALLNTVISGGASNMYKFVSTIFTPLWPVLRQKHSTQGLTIDNPKGAIIGLLWSKNLGHAIWISAGSSESEMVGPNMELPYEIISEKTSGPWKWTVWKVTAKRDTFDETLYDV